MATSNQENESGYMKVLQCKKCGSVSAFDISSSKDCNSKLKCPFCGYEEYYIKWQDNEPNMIEGDITDYSLHIIKESLINIRDGESANSAFDSLSRQFKLSTLALIRLSNVILSENEGFTLPNRHRFRRIVCETISTDDLFALIKQEIHNQTYEKDKNLTQFHTNFDDSCAWQEKFNILRTKHEQLKKDYDKLKSRLKQVEEELNKQLNIWK